MAGLSADNFYSLLGAIADLLSPKAANAEIIPQTNTAKQLLDKALSTSGQTGEAVRQLHARPEKVYLTDQPDVPMRLGQPALGRFLPRFFSRDYQITLNRPLAEAVGDNMVDTLAHESGHGLAQIAGIGGSRQPTGFGIIDMFAGQRLPKSENEAVADLLAGLRGNTLVSREQVTPRERDALKRIRQRLGLADLAGF